jgi:hypothetical protein
VGAFHNVQEAMSILCVMLKSSPSPEKGMVRQICGRLSKRSRFAGEAHNIRKGRPEGARSLQEREAFCWVDDLAVTKSDNWQSARRRTVHMTIRQQRVPPEQMEEVLRRVDVDWLETIRMAPGFVESYVVRRGEEDLVFYTAFLDESLREKGEERSAEWFGQRLMDLDTELRDMWHGPVVAHAGQH